jgi:hypothetical protein
VESGSEEAATADPHAEDDTNGEAALVEPDEAEREAQGTHDAAAD